jgi:hypothetical protein
MLSSCLPCPSVAGVVSSTPCRCRRTTSPSPAPKKCWRISGATSSAPVPSWCSSVGGVHPHDHTNILALDIDGILTIDGSEANAAAIRTSNQEHGTTITIRQVKYVNHLVEQDHRSVKRVTRPMWGFKSFDAAQSTLVGIELMHMLRKAPLEDGVAQDLTPAEQFYALAA